MGPPITLPFQFLSVGELPAGFRVADGEVANVNRDFALQFARLARLLNVSATQLTVTAPNFLLAELEITITASKASDVHTDVLEASLVEQLKVSGFEFSYSSESFLISADCGQYNIDSFEGAAAAGCGNAVGCLWSPKDLACASPRNDASTSISWAAPEIQVGPKSQATTGDGTNNGQLIMIIVVVVGFFVLAGIAFMYVRRKKPKVRMNPQSYEAPMSVVEVKNAAYDEAIEAIEVTDNAPTRDNTTGMVSYSYGETNSVDLDHMSESAFNEYGVMSHSSSSQGKARKGKKKNAGAMPLAWNVGDFDELEF